MSEAIKHECGIALVRLLKPLEYFQEKYGSWMYGIQKMYLLMEKQHNRGQDGAGLACIKFNPEPGNHYIDRYRSNSSTPIRDIFEKIYDPFHQLELTDKDALKDINLLRKTIPFTGELFLGHLRYGTYGKNDIEFCHPLMKQNNWITRNLVVAGNFNLTNVDELFGTLINKGMTPYEHSDTVTVLEKIGSFLDKEVEKTFRVYKEQGYNNIEITEKISENIDIKNILVNSCKRWDGGYAIAGLLGHGDAFVVRDPAGIRPAYYYHDDEVAVVTSERPPILTAFKTDISQIKEVEPGHALIIRKNGTISMEMVKTPIKKRSCSFERIYFSRGTDHEIYQERKLLGEYLVPGILKKVNFDLENTLFSFIPNTAEVAFYGMMKAIQKWLVNEKYEQISKLNGKATDVEIKRILDIMPRVEKIAVKDVKLRTFITQDKGRDDMVAHVYDVTYGALRKGTDTLVVIDDSIVRGTTLRQSILKMLDRLGPKKIIIVSSAPQIRYPDCYGIDMAKLGDLVAFQAAIQLLNEKGDDKIINEVYTLCKRDSMLPKEEIANHVKKIYEPFTDEEISARISKILKPEDINAEVEIIFQTINDLHKACPGHLGDWYFSGNYPTPGGNKVSNTSFMNFMKGIDKRAY